MANHFLHINTPINIAASLDASNELLKSQNYEIMSDVSENVTGQDYYRTEKYMARLMKM